jgi:Zn-dependent protease with chaperone function
MMRNFALGIALLLQAGGTYAAAEGHDDRYAALARADARLATIAERLQSANAVLCRQIMPVTGMILHSRDQYASVPNGWFANGPVEVQQVLPDSPAAEAGILPGDSPVRLGMQEVAQWPDEAGRPRRDAVFALLAQQPADQPLPITIRRAGRDMAFTLPPRPGCRAMVEVLTGETNLARADGRVIQISGDFVTGLGEEQLAVLVAHELGHAVLEHRRRLSEAGVEQGIAGMFGRNRRLARQAEVEADLISAHILENAGYDPQSAVRFWRSPDGERAGGGALRNPIYPSPQARANMIEQEIAQHVRSTNLPSTPDRLLRNRDQPFTH